MKCIKCGDDKNGSDFYDRYSICKSCCSIKNRAYRLSHRKEFAEYSRNWDRKNSNRRKIANPEYCKNCGECNDCLFECMNPKDAAVLLEEPK